VLGDTPLSCSASRVGLGDLGCHLEEFLDAGLAVPHERHEPLEDRGALGDVVFARHPATRDLQPQLGQLRQLGKRGRLAGLDLDQLPKR